MPPQSRTPPPRAAPRGERPLLLVDIDGVVSLFGFAPPSAADPLGAPRPAGSFHSIDGIPHFLSADAARHLLALGEHFELAWCSGWEERADEYLPALLGVPAGLPFLRFDGAVRGSGGSGSSTHGHWKLSAIDAHAGSRALAWIDDCLDAACREWAAARIARGAPTLLVQTEAAVGITVEHRHELTSWAVELKRSAAEREPSREAASTRSACRAASV